MKTPNLSVSVDVAQIVKWLVILAIALFARPDLSQISGACSPIMEAIMSGG